MDGLEEFICSVCGGKFDYSDYGISDNFGNPICSLCKEDRDNKEFEY